MDNFEKYIRENKASFEEHKADRAKLWANIELELDRPKTKTFPFWKSTIFRVAASVVILLGIAAFIGGLALGGNGADKEDGFVSQELQDIDMHYGKLVRHHVALVKNHPKLSQEDKEQFLSFMDELDQEYETLRLELGKNFGDERVLEAIIGNYKKRIELIENLLQLINDSKLIDEDYGYDL